MLLTPQLTTVKKTPLPVYGLFYMNMTLLILVRKQKALALLYTPGVEIFVIM